MTVKQLRSVFRKATDIQVDSVWMKPASFFLGANGEELMLRLIAPEAHQQAWLNPRNFSCRQLVEGKIQGDELVLPDGTRLRFFKLIPINLE